MSNVPFVQVVPGPAPAIVGKRAKPKAGSKYTGGGGQTPDEQAQKAAERGCTVRVPKDNELFIDIDNARDYARFKSVIELFNRVEPIKGWTESPSASGGQHRHIVVTLERSFIDHTDRIMFQAFLGSDLKREILSYERVKGGNPQPTVFFEPITGVKPVPKKTGFHCARCNFKNDFAEANQDDGTYLCFNCRVDE